MRLPIKFADNSVAARSKKSTLESLVNMYPEAAPDGAVNQVTLYQCSGSTEFVTLPDNATVHALHVLDNLLYAITTTHLYRIAENGTVTLIGTFSGAGLTDRVSVADNGITMVFVDSVRAFKYDVANGLVEFTSQTGMYRSNTVTFQDGYFIFNRTGTGQFFITALYDTTTDPLDFATAESSPDDTVAVISFANQLWLFGTKTIEIWYNSGNALFPFERISGAVIARGCSASYSVAKGVNALAFIGDDNIVYAVSPGTFVPQRISSYSQEANISSENGAYAFTFAEFGHEFYMLHLPNSDKTWCYDMTNGMWHERRSPRLSEFDLALEVDRHLSNCYTLAYGKKMIGNRSENGKIFFLDSTSTLDNGLTTRREAISAPVTKDQTFLKCSLFELLAEVNITTNQNPQCILYWTDDFVSWSDGVQLPLGKIGERKKRIIARRLGRFRQRTFRIVITDDVSVIILGAFVEGDI